MHDTGKPVSRVNDFEDKVAELEGLLRAGGRKSALGPAPTGDSNGRSGRGSLEEQGRSESSSIGEQGVLQAEALQNMAPPGESVSPTRGPCPLQLYLIIRQATTSVKTITV